MRYTGSTSNTVKFVVVKKKKRFGSRVLAAFTSFFNLLNKVG